MSEPDVLVSVERGVADVTVSRAGIVAEVRDYDVEGATGMELWTDPQGHKCVRHLVRGERDKGIRGQALRVPFVFGDWKMNHPTQNRTGAIP